MKTLPHLSRGDILSVRSSEDNAWFFSDELDDWHTAKKKVRRDKQRVNYNRNKGNKDYHRKHG